MGSVVWPKSSLADRAHRYARSLLYVRRYDSPGKRVSQAQWFSNMKRVAEFQCVEDFWGCFYLPAHARVVLRSRCWLASACLHSNARTPHASGFAVATLQAI
jgi:hypothetical protein